MSYFGGLAEESGESKSKSVRVCLASFEFGPAPILARVTRPVFRMYAPRGHCARLASSATRYGEHCSGFGDIVSDHTSGRGIACDSITLPNYRAPNTPPDLTHSHPRLVPTWSTWPRPSCLQSRSIATKRSSSLRSTLPPVPSREAPLYLIYFGVSIWAAVMGYGAYFYFSSPQNDSGPRTTLSGPQRKSLTSDLQHAISDLCQAFPDAGRVLTDTEVLNTYGSPTYTTYLGSEDVHPHGVVVFPLSTEDVVVVVNIARKWGVPIVPFGKGSSLEGHTAGIGNLFTRHGLA